MFLESMLSKFLTQHTDPIGRGFCHRGKLEVARNHGHEQAGQADRDVVPLWQNPLAFGSVTQQFDSRAKFGLVSPAQRSPPFCASVSHSFPAAEAVVKSE